MLDDAPLLRVLFGDVPMGDHWEQVPWPIPSGAEVLGLKDDQLRVRYPTRKKPRQHEVTLRAEGLLSLEGDALRFEYCLLGTFDDAEFTTPPRVALVPLAALREIQLTRRWLRRDLLVLEARSLGAFAGLPARVTGALRLPISRADRAAAQLLIAEARYRAAQRVFDELTA
jgi:hypothetical protein